MKKVLHLTTHLNSGGITVYILRLVEAMREHGFETAVFSSGGDYSPLFSEKKAALFETDIQTKSELHPKLFIALLKLVGLIRREKIDLLHAHSRVTQVLAFWAGLLTGVPVVTTCHGFYKHQRLGRRLFPAWGNKVVAISGLVGDHLTDDFGLRPSRVSVVNNAIDLKEVDQAYRAQDPAAARKSWGLGKDEKVIGIVARLVSDKGQEYLLRAFALLHHERPDLRLLIVGEGRDRLMLEKLARDLGIQERVVFTGNIPDVTKALAAMDIFAFPATWREGFGLSLIEAMACSKPVIATSTWALKSFFYDPQAVLTVDPRDVQTLAAHIRRLLQEPDLCLQLGQNARAAVQRHFTIERMALEMAAVYNEVLTGRGKNL